MRTLVKCLFLCYILSSCSEAEQEISDDLYEKAVLHLVFEEAPISQFYQNQGCVRIDSSRYYFGQNHYAVSKDWYSASIYKMGDTVGYFGGSCIFRTDVFILNRKQNQITRFDAYEFHRNKGDFFRPELLSSFITGDTLDVFNLTYDGRLLKVYDSKDERPIIEVQQEQQAEIINHFLYWDKENPAVPSTVYKVYKDSLKYSEHYGGDGKELLLIKSDSSYTLQEFKDSIKSGPMVSGKIIINPECR